MLDRTLATVPNYYCASRDEVERFKIDSITWQTKAWLVTRNSPLGSTIAFSGAR